MEQISSSSILIYLLIQNSYRKDPGRILALNKH